MNGNIKHFLRLRKPVSRGFSFALLNQYLVCWGYYISGMLKKTKLTIAKKYCWVLQKKLQLHLAKSCNF
jgi:hypothetical protein